MNQKKWDKTFIEIAKIVSEHSTCSRINVGALIVKDTRIISMGYNGVASGQTHCTDYFKKLFLQNIEEIDYYDHTTSFKFKFKFPGIIPEEFQQRVYKQDELEIMFKDWKTFEIYQDLHRKFSIQNEHHAEANAIAFAAKTGIDISGCTMYCTYSPCLACAKLAVASGIKRFVYLYKYNRVDDDGLEHLIKNNVEHFNLIIYDK